MSGPKVVALGLCVALVFLVTGSHGACLLPSAPANTTQVGDAKASYITGELIVWDCIAGDGRFGNIVIYCEPSGAWTAENRACADAIKIDGGSIFGMCMAAANIAIAGAAIIWSYKCVKKVDKDDEEEIEESAEASTA